MTARDASAGESFLKDNHLRDKNDDYQCRERLLRPPHYLTIYYGVNIFSLVHVSKLLP